MSDITLFNDGAGGGLSSLPRATKKALAQVQGHGLVAAAKLDAMQCVASVGVQNIGQLGMQATVLGEQLPQYAGNFKAVVDCYTVGVMGVLSRMGR